MGNRFATANHAEWAQSTSPRGVFNGEGRLGLGHCPPWGGWGGHTHRVMCPTTVQKHCVLYSGDASPGRHDRRNGRLAPRHLPIGAAMHYF